MNDATDILTKRLNSNLTVTDGSEAEAEAETKPVESGFGGQSGRFWITLVFAFGMVAVLILVSIALLLGKFPTDATTITALVGLIGGFLTTGASIVGMYIGQGQKPKSQQ